MSVGTSIQPPWQTMLIGAACMVALVPLPVLACRVGILNRGGGSEGYIGAGMITLFLCTPLGFLLGCITPILLAKHRGSTADAGVGALGFAGAVTGAPIGWYLMWAMMP